MANYMLVFLQNYDQRIQFLRSQGDQLLQSIKLLEIEMNQRRQRYLQPYLYQINGICQMTEMLFEMLSEIKACEYFKLTQRLVFFDDDLFKITATAIKNDLINKFNAKLYAKDHSNHRYDNDDDIDFLISQ